MNPQLAAAGTKGSASFIATHTVGLTIGGGLLVGLAAYYYYKKKSDKSSEETTEVDVQPEAA